MILIDTDNHVVATNAETELHNFVWSKIGLTKKSYIAHPKRPCYRLTERLRILAIMAGAVPVPPWLIVRKAWWAR